MGTILVPAEAFPAGEYLRDELEERGWTVTEFAEILARPVQVVSEILNGKKEITTETAVAIADALGTTPELWLNLQTNFRLYEQRKRRSFVATPTPVARRARLRGVLPLAEVRQRGWVPDTDDLDVLEREVMDLFETTNLEERPLFAMAARRSNSLDPITIEQAAWLARVRMIARGIDVKPFNANGLREFAASIPTLLRSGPQALAVLPKAFADLGVALVMCEGLRGGKLDGAVTFLANGRPVVGLTARGDRFDVLVFTLLHECAHLTLGHVSPDDEAIVDDDVAGGQSDPREIEANGQAMGWLFPNGFEVEATSSTAIIAAANRYRVHPSVVLGQVQRRLDDWKMHRSLVTKVRGDLATMGLLS